MRKTITILAAAIVLTLGLATAAFANQAPTTDLSPANPVTQISFSARPCGGNGGMRGNSMCIRGMMRDDDGNVLSRDAFEQRLDALIAVGIISADSRAAFLEMYDFCAATGAGANGRMGNCASGGRRGMQAR